jgi:predicted GNAT superfamily acetyltransferase
MIEVRPLTELAEFREAVRIQRIIWGFEDLELLPVRLFVVAEKVGGQVLGAFDGGRLIGFCLAIPGIRDGQVYLHSHMLGVLKEYRDAGAGRLLKFAQREGALARGIDLIEWTFDPLDIKNAYFNIERLGVIVRRFVPNQYGITTSHLQAGLPTDRCIAEWHLTREREPAPVVANKVVARISVPADIAAIKESDPARAREIQRRVAAEFLEHFSRDLAVTGFERTSAAGTYLLSPWPSK